MVEALCKDALRWGWGPALLCHQDGLLPHLQDVCGDAVQRQCDIGEVRVEQEVILSPVQFEPRADQRTASSGQ